MTAVWRMARWLPLALIVALAQQPSDGAAVPRRFIAGLPISPLTLLGLALGALAVASGTALERRRLAGPLAVLVVYALMWTVRRAPWPLAATLAASLVAASLMLIASAQTLRGAAAAPALVWAGAALAALALGSPLGVVAAAWALLAALLPAVPALLVSAAGVGWWLLLAAGAAAGSWLTVAVVVLAAACQGLAAWRAGPSPWAWLAQLVLGAAALPLIGWFTPGLLAQLALGLNGLGRLVEVRWIGLVAENAAHERVALLPLLAWLPLSLLGMAVWLVVARWAPAELAPPAAMNDTGKLWPLLRRRVWWLRG